MFTYAGHGLDLRWSRLPDAVKTVAVGAQRSGRIVSQCRFDEASTFVFSTAGLFVGDIRSASPFVLTLDDRERAFPAGADVLMVVGPGTDMSGSFEGSHEGEFVSIPPDAISQVLGPDQCYAIRSKVYDDTEDTAVRHLLRTIRVCLAGRQSIDPFAYESILAALVRLLAVRDVDARRAPWLTVDQAFAVRAMIIDGLDGPLTVGDLAGALDLSEGHFGRAFKESFGTSPYQYILQERVALARRLLGEGASSLETVARRAGFTSAATMTRAMKAQAGATARVIRAALRGMHAESS